MSKVSGKLVRLVMAGAMLALPLQGWALTVSTSDLADGAVTTPKIADGAVTQAKIQANAVSNAALATGAVTDAKISGTISGAKLGAHNHSGGDITDGTVTTSKLADGAVTDAKIAGVISGAKLGAHGHYGSDIVDGTITAPKIADGAITDEKISGIISASKLPEGVFLKKPANVITVAKTGGDFDDPAAALASVTNASSTNPYLIKIMPGVYTLSSTVVVPEYVTVEGSGQNATILRGTFAAVTSWPCMGGTIRVVGNTEVRNLTVEAPDGTSNNVGILVSASNSDDYVSAVHKQAKIGNVTVVVSGSGYNNWGIYYNTMKTWISDVKVSVTGTNANTGIGGIAGIPNIFNSEVSASGGWGGYGLKINAETRYNNGVPLITNVISSGSGSSQGYGVMNDMSTDFLKVSNSEISGTHASVYTNATSSVSTTYITNSHLSGPVGKSGPWFGVQTATNVCAGVSDDNYAFYTTTCP